MDDVLIVGAGPAGSVAALLLARAGARVRLVDRADFPRDKLCGDTINPGTLALFVRLAVARRIEQQALRVDGMKVSGEGGVEIDGRYPSDVHGLAITRRILDAQLLEHATAAGARFEPGVRITEPVLEEGAVRGAVGTRGGRRVTLPARMTIAADGRRSALAFALGLAWHPPWPRRWAVGGYYEGIDGVSTLGEMHLRGDRYLGIAPVPGGLANVCLVVAVRPGAGRLPPARILFARCIAEDATLAPRFARARLATPPLVLGPLAVDAPAAGMPGLLLAGDAAGFIDPMTGDGLRFAIRGAELAADAALDALGSGRLDAHLGLARARRAEFVRKQVFNRVLRRVVGSRSALSIAGYGAAIAPWLIRRAIQVAGDVPGWRARRVLQ